MTLGAQHVEATKFCHFVMRRLNRRLCVSQSLRPCGFVVFGSLNRRQTTRFERVCRHEFRIATEHDVGASSGHIGRNSNCALRAGLGDNRRLTLVVLRVEDLVRHTALLQQ